MGMLGVGLVVLLALALAAVYAMVRAGPDRHWRLVPGALAPLVVQLAVFGIWMSLFQECCAPSGESVTPDGVDIRTNSLRQ